MNRISFEKPTIRSIAKEETKKLKSKAEKSIRDLEEARDIMSSMHGQIFSTDRYLHRLIMQSDVNKSELLRLRDILHGHDKKM